MIEYSIVISTFNQKNTLAKILDSLARQISSPKIFEVIITDDGSNDGTDQFIKGLRFPIFLKYIRSQKSEGRAKNRNKGFEKAVGVWVTFLDGDMIPEANFISTLWAAWNSDLAPVYVGNVKWPKEWRSGRLEKYLYSRGRLSNTDKGQIPGVYFTSNNFSIRKEVFGKLAGFDPKFEGWGGEDTDFGLRLEKNIHKIYYLPEAICYHYHKRSITEVVNDYKKYGQNGYSRLIASHPDTVIFNNGWLLGLPDSKYNFGRRLFSFILFPLRTSAFLAFLRAIFMITGFPLCTNFCFDWLFYGNLAMGYRQGTK